MIIFFIVGLLLGGVAVIFALQNIETVSVSFLAWQLEGSLSLVLIMSVLVGMLIVLLFLLPEFIGSHFRYRSLLKKNKEIEDELRRSKEAIHFAQKTPATPEAIAHIQEGSIAQSDR